MKEKKYINRKSYNNIDKYKLKLINRYIQINNIVIENIVSVTVISTLMEWSIKNNKLSICGNITYKILYTSNIDTRISLIKEKAFFYDEVELADFIDGENLKSIESRGGFDIGCNVQDIAIFRGDMGYILIATTIMNWVEVKKIPRVVISVALSENISYLYVADKKLTSIKQITFDNNKSYKNIMFSSNGEDILCITEDINKRREIVKKNLFNGSIRKVLECDNVVGFQKIGEKNIVFEERESEISKLKFLNLDTLKVSEFIVKKTFEVLEIWSESGILCIVAIEDRLKKLFIFNKERINILTCIGEYRLPRVIYETNTLIVMHDEELEIINLNNKSIRSKKMKNVQVIEYKYDRKVSLIIKGIRNAKHYISSLNLDNLNEKVILESKDEIGDYFFEEDNEKLLTYNDGEKWILRRDEKVSTDNNLEKITGKEIKIIVRGEW